MFPFTRLKALPQRWKINLAGILVTVAVLIAGGYAFVRYDAALYKEQKVREVRAQARILAASVRASLVFLDPDATKGYVDAIRVNPEIVAAAVYDGAGNQVAAYSQVSDDPPLDADDDAYVTIREPVVSADNEIGSVVLSFAGEPLNARLGGYAGMLLALAMAAILLGVLVTGLAELAVRNARLQLEMIERSRLEEALRQSQKMETIGQLAGGIAHDFNNVLAIIISSLGLMKRRAARGETNLETYANTALEGAHRAASLTQRLLAFSRRQPLHTQPIDANRLVTGMSEMLRATLGENTQIETVIGGGLWRIEADAHQLESAILNLAVNSRDAMPGGGKLTIETANAHLDEAYCAQNSDATPGQYVMIAVSDTGSGMPPEVVAKAFEPFFTTKGVGKGTGLGLSQVYGFVKQSGGHLRIYSEESHGTAVKIYLPRMTDAAAPLPSEQKAAPVALSSDSQFILVVEDDDAVRKLGVDALRDLGYRVVHASNGRQALDLLQQHSDLDLLFTDVVMPEMDGRALAEMAKTINPRMAVLFTTGYTKNAVVHNGIVDHGVRLLSKPFTVEELSLQVRAALAPKSGSSA